MQTRLYFLYSSLFQVYRYGNGSVLRKYEGDGMVEPVYGLSDGNQIY